MIGIQPYYFRASYTFACPSLGYTAISGLYIPHIVTLMRHSGVYNLLFQGSIRLELVQNGIQPCYFRVLHTRHRHIQFPEVLVSSLA